MSSHREAPEIAKDPVADSTDVYAFVSPDKPDTVTLIANYIPLQGPAGGPNFYEFGDDVLYEIHVDNNGDGRADISLPVPVPHHGAQPGDLPVQHRADQVAGQPELEPPAELLVTRCRHAPAGPSAPGWPARRATSGRCPRRTTARWRPGRARARRRDHGVRRAAGRGRSTSTWARSSTWPTCGRSRTCTPVRAARTQGGARRQRHQPPERALDRDPGADLHAHQERPSGHRRLDHGQPPAGPAVGRRRRRRTWTRAVPAGVAAGQPAGQRGADRAGRQGPVELAAAVGRQAVRQLRRPIPAWRRCCPACTPACSRTWPRWSRRASRGPTWRRSC